MFFSETLNPWALVFMLACPIILGVGVYLVFFFKVFLPDHVIRFRKINGRYRLRISIRHTSDKKLKNRRAVLRAIGRDDMTQLSIITKKYDKEDVRVFMHFIAEEITDVDLLTKILNTEQMDIDVRMAVAERLKELDCGEIARLFYLSIIQNLDIDEKYRAYACRRSGGHKLEEGDCVCLRCGVEDHSPFKDRNHNDADFIRKYTNISYAGACSHCGKTKINYMRDAEDICYECHGKGIEKVDGMKILSIAMGEDRFYECSRCDGTGKVFYKNMLHTVWVNPEELDELDRSLM